MNDNWIEEKALLTAQRFAVSQHWNPLHISYNELIGKLSAAIAAALREAENRGLEKAAGGLTVDEISQVLFALGYAFRNGIATEVIPPIVEKLEALKALKTGEGR